MEIPVVSKQKKTYNCAQITSPVGNIEGNRDFIDESKEYIPRRARLHWDFTIWDVKGSINIKLVLHRELAHQLAPQHV